MKINIDEWILSTRLEQETDYRYIDSYHTDELLKDSFKRRWIEDGLSLLDLVNDRIKALECSSIRVCLIFALDRKRRKMCIPARLDYSSFSNPLTLTPPELFLVDRGYTEWFLDTEKYPPLHLDGYPQYQIFYGEKWYSAIGFDRWLCFYKED